MDSVDEYKQDMLADAIAEEKKPKVCMKHPTAIWHDSKTCPACDAERELLHLTNEMAVRDASEGDQ